MALVNGKKACKACVSKTSPAAKDAAKNCYRSVTINGGKYCGVLFAVAQAESAH